MGVRHANKGSSMADRALGKMLVGNMIVTAATRYPNAPAFYCAGTGRRLTFKQTNERCNRLANALVGLGLSKGAVLAFICSNRCEMAEIYFALAKSGIIGIPLNYRLAPAEMVELMREMGARALIYEARFENCALQAKTNLEDLQHLVAIGSASPFGLDYEGLLDGAVATEPQVEINESDPYYFNLTSGTTGLPKSYALTQFNNSALGVFGASFDMNRKDIVLTVSPVFGRTGLGWMLTSVSYGVPNVLLNFDPAKALELIEQERVTICNLVPTMASAMLASESLCATDLSSMRAIVFCGSMLSVTVREETAARLCSDVYEYYGMQETGVLVHSTPQDRELRPTSVGRVSLFSEVRIVGENDQPVLAGEVGEIIGRSPNSVTSYFRNSDKSNETFHNGWVHTGDLGSLDAEGFLYIRGRIKDMIITGGQNVYAAEVEDQLLRHHDVDDCAVIGLPDDHYGEQVVAVVVARPGVATDAATLHSFCRERLAGFKTPKRFLFQHDPLPRTLTGKVQKFMLVERYCRPHPQLK